MFTNRKANIIMVLSVLAFGSMTSYADGNLKEDSNQLENRAATLANRLKNDLPGGDVRVVAAQMLAGQATHFHKLVKNNFQPASIANEYYQLENAFNRLYYYVRVHGLPRGRDSDKFDDMSRAFYKVYAYFH